MFTLKNLPNGLEVITAPVRGTKTATVLFMIGTGSKYETKGSNGISHFLEHMFFKGTAKRPTTLAISSELDKVGGEYNAFTGKEYTGYWVKVEASQLELALDVLSDMLLNSKIDQEEINREKGVIIEELNMYLDNPLIYIEDLFEQCLYDNSPAGWDTIGTKANILKFKRWDFSNYLQAQYGPKNSLICLAGNIKPGADKLINKYFSSLRPSRPKDKQPVKENQKKPGLKVHFKKTDQAHLSLGVRAFPYGHKDEIILKIIAVLLGGSMSSRLFTELRERRGLAYYVRSQSELYTDSGYLTTQAGVPINKIQQAIKIILKEYKILAQAMVKPEELNKVKQCLIGRMALQFESSDSIASWYGRQAVLLKEQKIKTRLGNKIITPEDYYALIKKVRAEDILRVARVIFSNNRLNLAVIGPYGNLGKFQKILRIE